MTHENQGSIEVLVILLDIVHIIFRCLLLVYCIEIETRVVVLEGLEERSEGISETTVIRWSAIRAAQHV